MPTFQVDLKKTVDDSYDIEIGHSLSGSLIEDIEGGLLGKTRKFAVISDTNAGPLYAEPIVKKLKDKGWKAELFLFEAGEKSKTRQTKAMIEDSMIDAHYRRDCCVISVGGGVVSDLAGFIAGTYGRGVPFVNYATTLLSAADASVGGKTAVDTPVATNLIGLFNQPKKVYIDLDTWKTLPQREISCGMAETIKHACMADREFFEWLEDNLGKILQMDTECCEHMSETNCRIKYNVVMQDERESGLREVLNLGHTVGRAIETVSDYRLLHGEAVAIGLAAQAHLSRSMGYLPDEDVSRIETLLARSGLPVRIPDYIDREELVKKLYTDKKVRDGRLRFVVQSSIGEIAQFEDNVYAVPVSEDAARRIIYEL